MKRKTSGLSKFYMGLVLFFLYMPIFVLIFYSFNESKSRSNFTGFSLKWYLQLFQNDQLLSALMNTLIIAVVSSVAATILGTMAAVGIFSLKKWARSLVMNVTYLPIINPEIVIGVSLMLLFLLFKMEFGMLTLILAHISFSVPYVILNVLPKLRQMDIHLYEAAQDLGCSPISSFFKVVVPEIMPGVLSGFMMAFTYSLDDFIISYFTSGAKTQTLPIYIYSMARKKVNPQINALSTIIFVIVLVILLLINWNDSRKEKQLKLKRREQI